ncbi:MAG: glycosyltransferase family 2 protein [Bdellovibrionota bacterium]
MSLTICFCAYNEENNVEKCLDDAIKECGKEANLEILVIDNASTDRTPQVVQNYSKRDPRIQLVRHPENRFYSGSYRTALSRTKAEYTVILDGDYQHTAKDIAAAINLMREKNWDVLFGWKKSRHDGPARKLFSVGLRLISQVLLGHKLHDINCGFRIFNRKSTNQIELKEVINSAGPEIFCECSRLGLNVGEMPVQHFARTSGEGMHDSVWPLLKNTLKFLKYILHLRKRYRTEMIECRES